MFTTLGQPTFNIFAEEKHPLHQALNDELNDKSSLRNIETLDKPTSPTIELQNEQTIHERVLKIFEQKDQGSSSHE